MAPPLLTLQDIDFGFGGAPLLEAAELVISSGDRLCLVGRNGSGKSTLLRGAGARLQIGQKIVLGDASAGTGSPDRGELARGYALGGGDRAN